MPLPCSPASMSERGDTSNSQSVTESESESDLITPKPGPSNPSLRTHANLSTPLPSFKSWSSDSDRRFYDIGTSESEHDWPKRGIYRPSESEAEQEPSTERPLKPGINSSTNTTSNHREQDASNSGSSKDRKDTPTHLETEGHPPEPYAESANPDQSKPAKRKSPRSSPKLGPRTSPKPSPKPSPKQSLKQIPKQISPASTAPERPASLLEQRRSVTFSPSSSLRPDGGSSSSAYAMSRRSSAGVGPHGATNRFGEEAESSADENTAIFRRKTGVGTGVGYGGTTTAVDADHRAVAGYEGAGEEELDRELSPVERRRKSSVSRANGRCRSCRRSSGATSQESEDEMEREGFWKVMIEKYGSVELENKGSVARDHLALERTFLAWLRTSLSFASIGIAITQLFRLNTSLADQGGSEGGGASALDSSTLDKTKLRQLGKPLGATFLGVSILILLLGFHRYFESQHYVIQGKFPASRGSIVLVSFVAGALVVASLVVVVAVAPGAFEQ